jgi:hypothetical protein
MRQRLPTAVLAVATVLISTAAASGASTARAATPLAPTLRPATATTVATNSETPIPVPDSSVAPAGRRLSANAVVAIAAALPDMRAVRAKYPGSYGGAYLKPAFRWQVSFFSRGGKKEIGQSTT